MLGSYDHMTLLLHHIIPSSYHILYPLETPSRHAIRYDLFTITDDDTPDVILDWSELKIIGTCTILEKKYLRYVHVGDMMLSCDHIIWHVGITCHHVTMSSYHHIIIYH